MIKLLVSLVIGLVSLYGLILLGRRLKVYGQKSFRRIKEESVPQLGGIGIYFTLFVCAVVFEVQSLTEFLLIALPILIGGIIDDFREISARSKSLFQFFSAGLLVTIKHDDLIWNQFGQHIIITSVLTLFFVLALCNAVNFIDGLDGLVASYFLAVLPTMYLLPNALTDSAAYFVGAIAAFFYFNKKPAKIYLGDVGSGLVGLALAYSFLTHQPTSKGWHFIVLGYLMIFAIPLIDVTTSTVRRIIAGTSPFQGDKDHIHHRLLKVGLNDNHVAVIYFLIGALCSNVGWYLVSEGPALHKWSTLFSSVGVLTIILFLVFRTEGTLGRHISSFGRTLLETYVTFDKDLSYMRNSEYGRALIIDLFPYYNELQRYGLPRVVGFVKDVSGLITVKFDDSKIILVSSYSLAVLLRDQKEWSKQEITDAMTEFVRMTDKHRVTRLRDQRPEGVYFYNQNEFERLYSQLEQQQKDHRTEIDGQALSDPRVA